MLTQDQSHSLENIPCLSDSEVNSANIETELGPGVFSVANLHKAAVNSPPTAGKPKAFKEMILFE